MVQGAADVQKQAEGLVQEFGPAAASIKKFAEGSAASLGITGREAETTANRFGLLFTTLGVNRKQAAEMTINLEELAGAVSQIRNVPVQQFFQSLPLALGGNIRALRQLGIATNTQAIKQEALKEGLISTTKEALTPAAKAQAIYNIAIEQLPERLKQAQAHSNDLANVLRRLRAEFENQKDALGRGLLPAFSQFGQAALKILPGVFSAIRVTAQASASALKTLFNGLQAITGPIGGATKAVEAFILAFAARKVFDFVTQVGRAKVGAEQAGAAAASSAKTTSASISADFAATGAKVAGSFEGMTAASTVANTTMKTQAAATTSQISADFAAMQVKVAETLAATGAGAGAGAATPRVAATAPAVAEFKKSANQIKSSLKDEKSAYEALYSGTIASSALSRRRAQEAGEGSKKVTQGLKKELEGYKQLTKEGVQVLTPAQAKLASESVRKQRILDSAHQGFGAIDRRARDLQDQLPRPATFRSPKTGQIQKVSPAFPFSQEEGAARSMGARVQASFTGIGNSASNAGRKISSSFSSAFSTIPSQARKAGSAISAIKSDSGQVSFAGITNGLHGVGTTAKRAATVSKQALSSIGSSGAQAGNKVASGFKSSLGGLSAAAKTTAATTGKAFKSVGTAAVVAAETSGTAFKGMFTGIKAVGIATAEGIRAAFISALPILALTIVIQLIIEHFKFLKAVAFGVVKGIENSWQGLKDVLIGLAKIIGGAMATELTAPLRIFLEAVGHITGLLDAIGIHIGGSVKEGLQALKNVSTTLFSEGVSQAAKGGKEIAKAFKDGITSELNKSSSSNDPTHHIARQVGDGVNRSSKSIRDQIKKLQQSLVPDPNDNSIISARQRLSDLGTQLAQSIKQMSQDVTDAVNSAKSNLMSLAGEISAAVGQMLDAPIQEAQSKASRFSDLLTLKNLRESVLLKGGQELSSNPQKALQQLRALAQSAGGINKDAINAFIVQYQQAALAVKQDNVNITKETSQRRINDLADALSKGDITVKQFRARVQGILKKDKIPYQAAGQILGQSFLDGFHQTTQDLFSQAVEIQKSKGLGKNTSAFAHQIVKPLETLHNDQRDIKKIQQDIRKGERDLRSAEAKHATAQAHAAQKNLGVQQTIRDLLKQLPKAIVHEQQVAAAKKAAAARARKDRNMSPGMAGGPQYTGTQG